MPQVTEDSFCDAAVNYAKGELPSPQAEEATELTPEQLEDFNKANILKKVGQLGVMVQYLLPILLLFL